LPCQDAASAVPAGTGPVVGDGADLDSYQSLLDCLKTVPEPRRRCGIRHSVAVVLAFAVAAVLAGADSVTAVSEWAGDVPAEVLAALGAWTDRRGWRVPPSRSTFRRVLARLDGEAVAAAFGIWLKAQVMGGLADAAAVIVALDGKTVRGAGARDGKAPHLLAAMICGARAVLAQKDVDQKTDEITQVKPLLDGLDITGALVTADALHVQKQTARYLVEDKNADYLFTAVKDNQPSLFAALDGLDWENTPVTHIVRDRGHGRDETRTLQVLPAPRTLATPTPRRHSSSSAPSATPTTGIYARPPPPSASPAGAAHAAEPRKSSPRPPAVTGISKCDMRSHCVSEITGMEGRMIDS
jgi:predicted transposase YbfD/YdcC